MTFLDEPLLPEIEFPVQCLDDTCEFLTQFLCTILVGKGPSLRLNRVGLCQEHLGDYLELWGADNNTPPPPPPITLHKAP